MFGAGKRTRTSTTLRSLAPEASVSTISPSRQGILETVHALIPCYTSPGPAPSPSRLVDVPLVRLLVLHGFRSNLETLAGKESMNSL
jgi:hypothetical protein